MKGKLRNCVALLSPPRTNDISDDGFSNKVTDKKYPLNKKYNLRIRGKVDIDIKYGNTGDYTKSSAIEGKENKRITRSRRQVQRLSPEIKNNSSVSPINLGEIKNRNKITNILNVDKKSSGKKRITRKKTIQDQKLNDKVPLSEISNDNPKAESELKYVFVNKTGAISKNIVRHEAKFPIWRKILNEKRSFRGTKRKSFVDVYDISQDEDILSGEIRHTKQKINSRKNMKRCVNKTKGCLISNKNVKFNQKYTSNTKPVQNRLIRLKANHQTHSVNSNPKNKVSNTHFSSDKKLDIIQTSVGENRENCILTNVEVDVNITPEHTDSSNPEKNMNNINFSLDRKSNVQTSAVEENKQDCIHSPPGKVNMNISLEDIDKENVSTGQNVAKKSRVDNSNFLLDLADELEKSLLIPRMTSTPDTTLVIGHGTKPPEVSKITVLGLSGMISKERKFLKLPVKICSSVPRNEADITLFESPVKKSRKKEPVMSRSEKNVHINLFKDFSQLSTGENLEDSVLKPNKAYHSPDNFKTHLARTKRISEVINKETKKSKDDIMMEQMQQHFDEISGTELCIE